MAHNRANTTWKLPESGPVERDEAIMAILMDIRREMQELNRLLHCQNVVGGFRSLTRIDKRLRELAPLKKVRKAR